MKHLLTAILMLLAASPLIAAEFDTVEIRLASDPQKALTAKQGKRVEVSSRNAAKLVIVPGLSNTSLVSLQLKGSKKFYIRHHGFVLHLHEMEKGNQTYDADATFKLVHTADGKVRFESANYPGRFVTVNGSGTVGIAANSPVKQSTFTLNK